MRSILKKCFLNYLRVLDGLRHYLINGQFRHFYFWYEIIRRKEARCNIIFTAGDVLENILVSFLFLHT